MRYRLFVSLREIGLSASLCATMRNLVHRPAAEIWYRFSLLILDALHKPSEVTANSSLFPTIV
jgi:hypothetical protein